MSHDWVKDIEDMHRKFEFHKNLDFNGEFLRFRQRFEEEEIRELDEAILSNNPEAVVDALIDICVVSIGFLDLAGVNVQHAWNVVHNCNMQKERGDNPTRQGSLGVDLVKPDGWEPPNHTGNTGNIRSALADICLKLIFSDVHSEKLTIPSHIKILEEFKDFALSKTHDYDDEHDPEFAIATYFPNGINDIMYEISKKVKRLRRGLKRFFENGNHPLTDSLDDSFRDISIYAAIGYAFMKGKLEGQPEDRDIFNREISK